ncbi:MAG: hypothetical protein FJX76_15450 [Armatimonadetes bacterium]|nr:hypothetical protein [Armatimonadota bacterium]
MHFVPMAGNTEGVDGDVARWREWLLDDVLASHLNDLGGAGSPLIALADAGLPRAIPAEFARRPVRAGR